MGTLKLEGSIYGGPGTASDVFPNASFNAKLATRTNPKSYGAASGVIQQRLASPSAFVVLAGIGATQPVTRGDFLYLRCDSAITLRITHDDGAGGSTVVSIPVHGLYIYEFQDTKFLKALEAQGSALLEYFVSGPQ